MATPRSSARRGPVAYPVNVAASISHTRPTALQVCSPYDPYRFADILTSATGTCR